MISASELTDSILEKAESLGASMAGIANVASLKDSPSHLIYPKIGMNLHENSPNTKDGIAPRGHVSWPDDAVSAVVIGLAHDADKPELDWWDGRGTPGNRILMRISRKLSEWIGKTFSAKTDELPYFVEKGGIFLKDAAVNAGLGCVGKNNLVITPEYGPRVRFRALLLNREMEASRARDFNPCENCGQPCREACPANAFQNTVYSARALGQSVLPGINGTYSRVCCNTKMEKDIDQAIMMGAESLGERQRIRQSVNAFEKNSMTMPDAGDSPNCCVRYCRKCELSCPVGKR